MNFSNSNAAPSGSASQQMQGTSTTDPSQHFLQQLQLVIQQQQQNQQPLTNNNLAIWALLGNPLASLSLPAASFNTLNPLQQLQQQLVALSQLPSSVDGNAAATLPLLCNFPNVASNSLLAAADPNANSNYLQLLSLAQLQSHHLPQQQQQQFIAQLLNSSAATTTYLSQQQLGTRASATIHGAERLAPTAAAAYEASVMPLTSSISSCHNQKQPSTTNSTPATYNASNVPPTNRPPLPLTTEYDKQALNPYQCLLREQIELFETGQSTGVEGCSQGRNHQIQIGQVGIRCKHCARLPNKARPKGAVYYSKTVRGIYQTAQNMAHVHFAERCKTIPNDLRLRLQRLYGSSRRATAGKDYWEECLRAQGVYEDGQMLRFKPLSGNDKKDKAVMDRGIKIR